jgi:hypothetical protein
MEKYLFRTGTYSAQTGQKIVQSRQLYEGRKGREVREEMQFRDVR